MCSWGRRCGAALGWAVLAAMTPASLVHPEPPAVGDGPLWLQGRVTDAQGAPIAHARVELRRMPANFEWSRGVLEGHPAAAPVAVATSDTSGRYALTAPEPGVWEVVVDAPGRVPMRLRPVPLVRPTVLPPVSPPEDVGALVEVRGLEGAPPRDAWVYAESAEADVWADAAEDGWRPAARLGRPDARGPLSLPRAPGERLRVTVLAPGRETGVSALGAARIQVTVQPEPLCPRWVEVQTRESEGSKGGPVPGAVVALGRLAWPAGVTDDDGRVEVRGPRGEEIPVFVLAADGRRASGRLAIPGECASDDSVEALRFELGAVSGLRGRVVDAAVGQPVPGALVWPGHDPGTFVRTGADGGFRLPVPSFERFWVQAEAPGRVPRARWVTKTELVAGELPDLPLERAVSLDGRVTDTRGTPVAGALLTIRPEPATGDPPPFHPGRAAGRAVSDAQGRFRLSGLRAAGGYGLAATRSGYRPAERRIEEIGGKDPDAPDDAPDVVLRLVEAARIRGRVVISSTGEGEAIAGAGLWITEADAGGRRSTPPRRQPDAVTDDEGRFVIEELWPGEAVDLMADAEGFLVTEIEGIRPPLAEPLEVRLDPASSVEGRVVWVGEDGGTDGSVDGHGVEATVRLEPAGPPPGTAGVPRPPGARELSTRTDAEGRFRFDEVAPGAVVLDAVARGLAPSPPLEVEVPERGGLDGLVLEVRRGAVLEGWITDRRGEPVENARVRVARVAGRSDEDGRYRVDGVEPGTRTVEVEHPEFNRLTREVEIDPEWTAADFELVGGWPVAGRVVDEGGRAIAEARVEIVRQAAREQRRYRELTGEDGAFEIPRVAEGTYSLAVAREGFAARIEPRALRVEGRGVEDLEVVLSAGTTVAGRLLGLEPEQRSRVRVTAENTEGLELAGQVDPAGHYRVDDLGPGDWRVRGRLAGGTREAVVAVSVEPRQRRVERDLEFGGGLRLTGVVFFGGSPLAGARVTLSGYESPARRGVVSDAEGGFEMADLSPGSYRLSVSHQRELAVHNEDLELSTDRHVRVEVRTAGIAGRVTTAGGEPVADAMVLVRQRVGERDGSLFTVATAPDGGFRLVRLTAGSFDLTIRKPGFAPWERSLHLEPGEVVAGLEAVLEPTQGLVLAVRLAAGGTPPQVTVSAFDPEGRLVHAETLGLTADGHGVVGALAAGSWQLQVTAPGGAPVWVAAEVPGDPVPVILPAGGALRVRVPALLEAGLSGGLTLTDAAGRPFLAPDRAGVLRTVWPLEGGVTVLDGVPEGVWTLTATGPEGRTWQTQVTVPGGGEVDVRLE